MKRPQGSVLFSGGQVIVLYSSPEFLALFAGRDVTGDVSENPSAVFHESNRFLAQEMDEEGKGSLHRTNVGLNERGNH